MRHTLLFSLMMVLVACSPQQGSQPEGEVLARINNYVITQDEFEADFADSAFAFRDTPEARQEFLDNLINQKLILQYAQKSGIDRTPNFLERIEKFWEQSLLKEALDYKAKQISYDIASDEKLIKQEYDRLVTEGLAEGAYADLREQIRWKLTKEKQSQMMGTWVDDLRKDASVTVNESLLLKK